MRSLGRPLHRLLFHEPIADDVIDGRLHKRRADRVTVSIAFARVWNEGLIVLNVDLEFGDASRQFGHDRRTSAVDLEVTRQAFQTLRAVSTLPCQRTCFTLSKMSCTSVPRDMSSLMRALFCYVITVNGMVT